MHCPKMMALSLPFLGASLTACQAPQLQTQLVTLPPPTIPRTLLLPTKGPYRPQPGATQIDAALVIEDFKEALAACNADKESVTQLLRAYADGVAGYSH